MKYTGYCWEKEYATCGNTKCPYEGRTMLVEMWQQRPLEDALQQKLDKAKAWIAKNYMFLPQGLRSEATRLLKELEEE